MAGAMSEAAETRPSMALKKVAQFALLALAGGAATLASRAVGPLQEAIRLSLAFTDTQMALLQGPALALPVVMTAIPLGMLVDRLVRVRLLILFCGMNIAGCLLTTFASTFALLFVARCLVGLSVAATTITIFSLLADHFVPEQRGRAKAVLVLGQYAGSSAAFALGGSLLAFFGGADGWRSASFWLTIPLLAFVLLSLLFAKEPQRTGTTREVPAFRSNLSDLWKYRNTLLPLMAAVVLSEIPSAAVMTWTAPAFQRGFGLEADSIGALIGAAILVSGIIGPIAGGVIADLAQRRGGPKLTFKALAVISLLCVPGSLFSIAPSLYLAGAGLVVLALAMSATMATAITLFTIVIPNEIRGLCLALLSAAIAVFGLALPPLAVSGLSIFIGGPTAIGTSLAVVCGSSTMLAAITFFYASSRYPAEKEADG